MDLENIGSFPLSYGEQDVMSMLKDHMFIFFGQAGLNPLSTKDWKKGIFQLFGVEVIGLPDLNKENYILASNHISDFDAIIIGLLHPKIRITAKVGWTKNEELMQFLRLHYDITGFFRTHEIAALPDSKKGEAKEHNFKQLRKIRAYLKEKSEPRHLLIFPQGTISDINKNSIERINPGYAKMALANDVKIIDVFIEYPKIGAKTRIVCGLPYSVSNSSCDFRQDWLNQVVFLQNMLCSVREPVLREKHLYNNKPGDIYF